MDADTTYAGLSIEISHPAEQDRLVYFQKFLSLQRMLNETTGFEWQWNEKLQGDHMVISSISRRMESVSILNRSDWPAIISFLKAGMIALDEFWNLVKEGFE